MSSPLGNIRPNFFQRLLIKLHKKTSHQHRVNILSGMIYNEILPAQFDKEDSIKVLDVGCGDMQIIHSLENKLPAWTFHGIDVFTLPDNVKSNPYWKNYTSFNGEEIPFDNKYFDVVLLIDVLHHVDAGRQQKLLNEVKRIANFVIIKDHYEYDFFSRQILRLMDFAGNWAYGVSVPKKYFTKLSFGSLMTSIQSEKIKLIENIDLYKHLKPLNYILKNTWQFIYFGKLN